MQIQLDVRRKSSEDQNAANANTKDLIRRMRLHNNGDPSHSVPGLLVFQQYATQGQGFEKGWYSVSFVLGREITVPT